MAEHVIKLPDVGEGVAEAELVEWNVKVGDVVSEDATLGSVMTDKATVEIPSPVSGEVLWLGGKVGDVIAVGSDLVRLKTAGEDRPAAATPRQKPGTPERRAEPPSQPRAAPEPTPPIPAASPVARPSPSAPLRFMGGTPRPEGEKPLAAPAVRLRAREAGIDLRQVPGTGPAGRITHEDLDTFIARGRTPWGRAVSPARSGVEEVKIVGLRRRIAERMALANARIPHITYVEEVDVTQLEELRETLNKEKRQDQERLTLLPFLMRAMVRAIADQPNLNALFDDEAGIVRLHAGVHIGIAAQTPMGLMVPVVRHVEALDLWGCAAEVRRLGEAAKAGTATRDELVGSTITITSLGALGGVVSTPIINPPEVAIVGVNKMMVRPVWNGMTFLPRKMMNLSSSFDHRVIDGWEAARFIQRIKTLLETPALIFTEG
ncbi:MAG TPA: dihydrolipoamide acetyltransferase family protein [Stellaceae bacterium]|nr:dihydrolipoamide acetyltransferase family protein [Stellaceae bacterium]